MNINRRTFTRGALGAAAVAASGGPILAGADPLLTRKIPSSGEQVPIVGVGTNRYGVGDDADLRAPLIDAMRKFHELGGTVVDTAPGYGSSEIVLGEITRELGIVDDLFMATKVDVPGSDASAERMTRSAERLHKPSMDLMQVHNFRGWQDAIPVMQEWKDAGKIRYTGITTSRSSQYELMEQVMKTHDLDFIQINYSLANQRKSAERILPLAADRGIAVMVNRPFGGGGVFKTLAKTAFPEWAQEIGAASWAQFLLKYSISHSATTCAIPGMTKARHVADNLAAATGELPDAAQRKRMEQFFDGL